MSENKGIARAILSTPGSRLQSLQKHQHIAQCTLGANWRSAAGAPSTEVERLAIPRFRGRVATLAVVVAALALPYAESAAALLGFVPLSLPLIGSALQIVAGYILTTEAVKLGPYARKRK